MKHRFRLYICFLLIFLISLTIQVSSYASTVSSDSSPKTIRVGWYDYEGFYMMDANGYRSGYGYDYLQEISRYTGWNYEYVTGTVTDCIRMLEEGEIDLLPSVMYSYDRAKTMDFSKSSMGKNYSVLTTLDSCTKYQIGDFNSFNGITIGVIKGDIRYQALKDYAADNHFTYQLVEYETPALLENALADKKVEAILTTNMRVSNSQERILAQFSPVDFYIVTQKGKDSVLNSINTAMDQIEFTRKGFQSELAQKYFSVDLSGSLSFTEAETAFLKSHPTLRVLLPAARRPMVYEENGEFKGIIVNIMDEIASRLGVTFTYTTVATQEDSIKAIQSGNADIIANTFTGYNWAEQNNLFLSRPYMTLNYVSVTPMNKHLEQETLRVAAVKGYYFSYDYIQRKFAPEQITWYDTETDCIDAVQKGYQDICYVSSLAASEYLSQYKYRNLMSSIISYSHGLSISTSAEGSLLLINLIDKSIASIGTATINNIIDHNTVLHQHKYSFTDIILRFPVQFVSILIIFISIIIVLVATLFVSHYKNTKNDELYRARLAAEHDSLTGLYNRLAYEIIVSEKLQKYYGTFPCIFAMIDLDNFKQVNDLNSHVYGDIYLKEFATALSVLLNEYDVTLCRMGGDEFSLFFKGLTLEDAKLLLENTQKKLLEGTPGGFSIPCSIGIALATEHLYDFSSLYSAADKALYCAKKNGRGIICTASEDSA